MVLVVLGLDALDPGLVDPESHQNLTLDSYRAIETINSVEGEPSTHELWPTIITGLKPAEHGLVLDDGVAWENPFLRVGSSVADYLLPSELQTRIGAWLLNNTEADAFRTPATYYSENDLTTVFDGRESAAIGIPNYVVDPDTEDREHTLRRNMGDFFERDPDVKGGHTSADLAMFYEQCMEMAMIRIARARRSLRSRQYELVFAYTSGLDLIGHVSHSQPARQQRAYDELNEFVGELRTDMSEDDELLLVSDHGLQDGVHTNEAMVAGTTERLVTSIDSVTDIRLAIDAELDSGVHADTPARSTTQSSSDTINDDRVRSQLEDLGYI